MAILRLIVLIRTSLSFSLEIEIVAPRRRAILGRGRFGEEALLGD